MRTRSIYFCFFALSYIRFTLTTSGRKHVQEHESSYRNPSYLQIVFAGVSSFKAASLHVKFN